MLGLVLFRRAHLLHILYVCGDFVERVRAKMEDDAFSLFNFLSYRRKDDNLRLRVEIAIRAIASELTIA